MLNTVISGNSNNRTDFFLKTINVKEAGRDIRYVNLNYNQPH